MNIVREYTNKGNREENQDYLSWCSLSDKTSIYVLADGMGGYSYGDIAAKITVEAIIEFVEQNIGKCPVPELLQEAIVYANDSIMLKKLALSAKQMGCVVVILLLIDDYAFLAWLGDSRIYMFRDGLEVYRTEDHSIVNELSKINTLSAKDYNRYSSIVTKSVMGHDTVETAPVRKVKIMPGDVFVLCSDGYHKEFSVSSLANSPDEQIAELQLSSGQASDNFSFIRVQVISL